jgi:arginyl-tRNA--protein-N-Asp/Glu arginylyltransferase
MRDYDRGMESLFCFQSPPGPCGYLPDQIWQLEYEYLASISPAEYMERMRAGWRRFGHSLFHNCCPSCNRCQSLRVLVERFQPNRAQRRCWKLNAGSIQVRIGKPSVSRAKVQLYDRFHAFQTEKKSWPLHPAKDSASYAESFVHNPFPTQEWCYYLEDRLMGVGYVDDLPGGLSAIYFFYDPDERHRSLGTFNVLSVIEYAKTRGIPHVYLGYFVEGCRSMEYKATFGPNQVFCADGEWRDFR